jgi:hypothetical protein
MNHLSAYQEILARKSVLVPPSGLAKAPELNSKLFPFQRDVTAFLLEQGRSAAFLDTGLGKTFCQLEYGRVVVEHTNAPVLVLTPLAVGPQTAREAAKFGIDAAVVETAADVKKRVNIANYEKLHHFDPSEFAGVILDESSILKSFTGTTTRQLISSFAKTPFRLACTATPAPNDHMELGQHAQFLGAMNSNEMLSRWFIADQTNMGRYRLKGHATSSFWDWVAGWARCVSKPSDLGYSDEGFELPALEVHEHVVDADRSTDTNGLLFRIPETSATSIHKEKRLTCDARAEMIAAQVNADREPWLVWCDTDYEADALKARIPDAVEVRGSMPSKMKEERILGFLDGTVRVLLSKPSICGFGLNFQHCARVAFVGLSFSYESYYQAIRRCWRFGQKRPVQVHVAMADTERAIHDTVTRKAGDHDAMKSQMSAAMKRAVERRSIRLPYNPKMQRELPQWLHA